MQTREGVKTLVMPTARSPPPPRTPSPVKSSDGVETSFAIDGDTRFGWRNQPAPSAELKVGEDAFVANGQPGRVRGSGPAWRRRGGGKATP